MIELDLIMVKVLNNKTIIEEVITRWVSTIYPSKDKLREALFNTKKPMRIYIGVDPTGSDLHLGHLTNFLVMKRLQQLEHKVIFLVGDFTAMIGDPTNKSAIRKPLTREQVRKNMRTFKKQASLIISFSGDNPAEVRFNSEWYRSMSLDKFMGVVGYFTVRNMLNRDMFKERSKNRSEEEWLDAVGLKELIYPLLQGYDGVEMDVDIELGGNDQIFNMSIGRALRKAYSEKGAVPQTKSGDKFFVATTLLINPRTGEKLMNKSDGGMINLIDKPEDMFGKVMALNDEAMFQVAELSSEMDLNEVKELKEGLEKREMNPRDVKFRIAEEVVRTIFGVKEAEKAKNNFDKVFSRHELPSNLPSLKLKNKKIAAADLVFLSGVVKSKTQAWRLVEQGALSVEGKVKNNPKEILNLRGGESLKIGKKSFFRVVD